MIRLFYDTMYEMKALVYCSPRGFLLGLPSGFQNIIFVHDPGMALSPSISPNLKTKYSHAFIFTASRPEGD